MKPGVPTMKFASVWCLGDGVRPVVSTTVQSVTLAMPRVHDLDESPPRDAADLDDVAGLDVAVDHAHLMHVRDGTCDLHEQLRGLAPRERSFLS
jgi:hypothetical protein